MTSAIRKLQHLKRREEKKERKKKKKISKSYQNSDDDTIGSIKKISTRRIQQHQERSSMVTGMDHMSGPKASESRHLWMAHVAYFVHRLWPSLMLLSQKFFNGTCGVIIGALVCLQGYFLSLFFLSLHCNL